MSRTKKPKPARGKAYGILNPYGDLWTYEHFPSEIAAMDYIDAFWKNTSVDKSKFKIVRVRVTVSALPPPPSDAGGAG